MKNLIFGIITFALLSLQAWADNGIGSKAPAFSLMDSAGKTHTLEEYAGKNVILEWTNHDCPFVKKHYESNNMQQLQKKYTAEGVVWLSIISSAPGKQGHVDSATANQLTASRNAAPSAVLFDPEGTVGKQYGAKTTPHMYIIDKAGTLVYAGGIDSIQSANIADIEKAENYVDLAMSELNANKALSKPLTRPYGCSVKYL